MARWDVRVEHDESNQCLHIVHGQTLLDTREAVSSYFEHGYAGVRAFKLPADSIIRYDGMSVAPDVLRWFIGMRDQFVARVGGRSFCYATTVTGRSTIQMTTTGESIPNTYELAVHRMLLVRASAAARRQPSFETIRRRVQAAHAPPSRPRA